jgi:hypothetical protein
MTIIVPVVFMVRYVMILRGATSLNVLEGVGPENQEFWWALKWHQQSECHLGPKMSRFSGPTPSNAPSNDVAPPKIITFRAEKIKKIDAIL